ncbi:uncharacterized protein LOC127707790 [Mytilus californianus]|uniref:uncharacterized protein LOC127707790 n=1 Tax=Mytilus californianus TaxID=6549 RepID=UPI002245197B|nr:uncharacterized protein LOC127707790 [Mytilus californianus]
MYNCSSLKGKFMKTFANGKNGEYNQLNILFRLYYEEVDDKVKVNRKCVALESCTEKYNASSYSFQLRDCNDKLPVLCRGHRKETKNDSNVSTTSFITPVENANHLNEGTAVMGVVNVLLFALLMIFALLYVMVNRRRNALPYPRKMKKSKIIEV